MRVAFRILGVIVADTSSSTVVIVTAVAAPLIAAIATVVNAMIGARASRAASRAEEVASRFQAERDECRDALRWTRDQFAKLAAQGHVDLDPYPEPTSSADTEGVAGGRPKRRRRR